MRYLISIGLFCTTLAVAQTVPLYRVTVVERTLKAVNYQYRNGPTAIDFRGTVLLPQAKGDAVVESKAGRTDIDAHFDHLAAPTRFGPEYLTYVLWAITPEGHAKNLGEVVANGSDKAHLHVTTDLQAFGMVITAEPYSAVRQPSDVVVAENQVRPDTVGKIEQVQAKYELLPRGSYTYEVSAAQRAAEAGGRKVSMDEYESTVEVYQAQNAVQIARAAGADQYAADTLQRAEVELRNAQDLLHRKADRSSVVTAAREAAQTAEDARMIAVRHKDDADLAAAREQAARSQAQAEQAQAEAQRARSQAMAERERLEKERTAQQVAVETATAATQPATTTMQAMTEPLGAAPPPPPPPDSQQKVQLRVNLLQQLDAAIPTHDTPRGLQVTITDNDFAGTALRPGVQGNLARIASVLRSYPGLTVEVDGNCDNASGDQIAYERATAVREALVRNGVSPSAVTARGLGSSRPLASNDTAGGRMQNRRVEIVISGDPIGNLAYWDRKYSVVSK